MGSDFQLIGNQEDEIRQQQCVLFLSVVDELKRHSGKMFEEGDLLHLINLLTFLGLDPDVATLIEPFEGECTFTCERFVGMDQHFMFDKANKGLICSTSAYPDAFWLDVEDDRTIVGAGIRYRGPWIKRWPLDAVSYYVVRDLFVPNLSINDDQLFYQSSFDYFDQVLDPDTTPAVDSDQRYWQRKWARRHTMSINQLAWFTVEFHEALMAKLTA